MTAKGFLLLFLLPLVGCSTVARKQSAAESTAIYATQRAIAAGRFDLAKQYNEQATRLVPAPKKKIVIAPVISQGKRYVVLPPESNGLPTLTIGSPVADSLISKDKALQGQLASEEKALEKTTAATDSVIAAKEKIVEKAETDALLKSHSFWGRVKFYGFITLGLLGLGALCYFFPPAIPILLSIGKTIVSVATSLISSLISFIGGLFSKWKSKTTNGGTP